MKSFAHYNARSIDEAVELLAMFKGRAVLNAGGTDILGRLKDQCLAQSPEAVINIKTIHELDGIEENASGLTIGALTPLADVIRSPIIAKTYSVLKATAVTVASPQLRTTATIGGNLCQETRCWYYRYPNDIGGRISCFRKGGKACPAVPGKNQYHAILGAEKCFSVCPSDMAVSLTALDATLSIVGPSGTRTVSVEAFYNPLGTVLKQDEMITYIHIPAPPLSATQVFYKFTLRKPIDFAVVSVAALINVKDGVCADARIALGAVAHRPFRCVDAEHYLKGKPISMETAARAAEMALAGAKPLSQTAYKVNVAKALVKRAIINQEPL